MRLDHLLSRVREHNPYDKIDALYALRGEGRWFEW